MKRFIRYLYEYQDGRRVRNVGFVKVEDAGDFLALWIYGKGFPAALSDGLEIFLFYQNEDKCVGIPIGEIAEMRSMTAYQFQYEGDTSKIEGIILKGAVAGAMKWYGALWNDRPVDIEHMVTERELEFEQNEKGAQENEETQETEPETREKEEVQEVESETQENEEVQEAEAETQENEERQSEEQQQSPVYKITRKDIVQLPRQEWKLANNHFLMHGCRNFHHLVSFEKDGKCWLGVPGIYHQQEERAAQAFGFGQFMKPEEGEVTLSEEEQTNHGDFGYWCRIVNNIITSGTPV